MNNLKKFATEADYTAATLNYPAVSWVTGTDTVHFDKTAPVVTNNKVKIAFTTDACGEGKQMNLTPNSSLVSNINSLTVNGEPFTPSSSEPCFTLAANTDYLIEYELKDDVTDVDNWFAIQPSEGCSSTRIKYDILFPVQVTTVTGLYEGGSDSGINSLLFEETTPPSVSFNTSSVPNIYVPDSAVNTYKTSSGWDSIEDHIFPISEYSGDIPVE